MKTGAAVLLDEIIEEEEVVPFGILFAEEMAAPAEVVANPKLIQVYASTTYTTSTPSGPDNPVEDTER